MMDVLMVSDVGKRKSISYGGYKCAYTCADICLCVCMYLCIYTHVYRRTIVSVVVPCNAGVPVSR